MGTLRRIGLLGDVHAEDEYLAAALAAFASQDLDAILSVGDVVDGRGDAARCCHLLVEAGVLTVRGNHDEWLLAGVMRRRLTHATQRADLDPRALAFLGGLPATRALDTPAGRLLLCHGLGEDVNARLLPEHDDDDLRYLEALQALLRPRACDLLVGGHTHRRMVRAVDGLVVVNPGTLARGESPGFAVLDLEALEVRFFDLALDSTVVPGDVVALPERGRGDLS